MIAEGVMEMANKKKLIDAEALRKAIREEKWEQTAKMQLTLDYIDMLIDDQPAADAVVEVVRCKDCKHWRHFDHLGCTDFAKVCGLANYMIGANGYCLYGERMCE